MQQENFGHICDFKQIPNRGIYYVRRGCFGYIKNKDTCGCQISKQCCNLPGYLPYCNGRAGHWKEFCFRHTPRWDYELSSCANLFCDEKNIPLEERKKINQKNITEILGLPNNFESNHISDSRRDAVKAAVADIDRERKRKIYLPPIDSFSSDESDFESELDAELARDKRIYEQKKQEREEGSDYKRYKIVVNNCIFKSVVGKK